MNLSRLRLSRSLSLTLLLLTLGHGSKATAARIAEPETVLYGRVVQRVGSREFPLTQGKLQFRWRTGGPSGREHTLSAPLRTLGDGRFSYVLRIPHQTRAYDLSVASTSVPLSATPTPILDLTVTLDGQPLAILPSTTGSLSVSQQLRASARRLDFELSSGPQSLDSDQDGLPDWWEDEHGLDKWDPSDAATATPTLTPTPPSATAARTFAEWRKAVLPEDNRPLEIVADDDPDHDGVSNFLEYAFDLNPSTPDDDIGSALPHLSRSTDGPPTLAFRRRTQAADLQYIVESSPDLVNWNEPALPESGSQSSPAPNQFFRVRVLRQPVAAVP